MRPLGVTSLGKREGGGRKEGGREVRSGREERKERRRKGMEGWREGGEGVEGRDDISVVKKN